MDASAERSSAVTSRRAIGGAVLLGTALLALPVGIAMATDPTPTTHRTISTTAPVYAVAPSAAAQAAGSPVGGHPDVDVGWVATVAAAAGIPAPAVRAYGRAVVLEHSTDPSCGIGWSTLAGIGWVESQHGTIGGRTLAEDGVPSSPILGPALDGSAGLAAIPATPESTRWHGDSRWDHAVGPFQFIPSTWRRWASDGDFDGTEDPNDIDDAAYAAARYLCHDGYDMSTGAGWGQAVFAYNHAQEYIDAVYAAAQTYVERTR
jgi:membrane-bound lytic murein transglycosylase B